MKVGSIVECINDKYFGGSPLLKFPVFGEMYTIRDIVTYGDKVGYRLEEIINPPQDYVECFGEVCFMALRFRELLPPQQIEELIGDALTVPVKQLQLVTKELQST